MIAKILECLIIRNSIPVLIIPLALYNPECDEVYKALKKTINYNRQLLGIYTYKDAYSIKMHFLERFHTLLKKDSVLNMDQYQHLLPNKLQKFFIPSLLDLCCNFLKQENTTAEEIANKIPPELNNYYRAYEHLPMVTPFILKPHILKEWLNILYQLLPLDEQSFTAAQIMQVLAVTFHLSDSDLIQECLTKLEDKNLSNERFLPTLLRFALEFNQLSAYETLLKLAPDFNVKQHLKDLLPIALSFSNNDTALKIITSYAKELKDLHALHFAAASGDTMRINKLLEQGFSSDKRDEADLLPLHYAVRSSGLSMCEMRMINPSIILDSKDVYQLYLQAAMAFRPKNLRFLHAQNFKLERQEESSHQEVQNLDQTVAQNTDSITTQNITQEATPTKPKESIAVLVARHLSETLSSEQNDWGKIYQPYFDPCDTLDFFTEGRVTRTENKDIYNILDPVLSKLTIADTNISLKKYTKEFYKRPAMRYHSAFFQTNLPSSIREYAHGGIIGAMFICFIVICGGLFVRFDAENGYDKNIATATILGSAGSFLFLGGILCALGLPRDKLPCFKPPSENLDSPSLV